MTTQSHSRSLYFCLLIHLLPRYFTSVGVRNHVVEVSTASRLSLLLRPWRLVPVDTFSPSIVLERIYSMEIVLADQWPISIFSAVADYYVLYVGREIEGGATPSMGRK